MGTENLAKASRSGFLNQPGEQTGSRSARIDAIWRFAELTRQSGEMPAFASGAFTGSMARPLIRPSVPVT